MIEKKSNIDYCSELREMRERNEHLHIALENEGMSVWRYDVVAKVFSVLEGCYTLLDGSVTIDDLEKEQNFEDFEDFKKSFHRIIAGEIETSEVVVSVIENDDNDNKKIRYYRNKMNAIKDENGKVIFILGSRKDITKRIEYQHEAEAYQKKLELINAEMNEVMDIGEIWPVVWNLKKNQLFFAVPGLEYRLETFDEESGDVLSFEYVLDHIHPDDREGVMKLFSDISEGKSKEGSCKLRFDERKIYDKIFEVKVLTSNVNEEGTYVGFMHNITKQEMLNRKLIEAKRKAEESERMKLAFVANIGHEIRTPLNALVGFTSILADDSVQLDQNTKNEAVATIEKNNKLLLSLINDIIKLASAEAERTQRRITTFELGTDLGFTFRLLNQMNDNPDVTMLFDIPQGHINVTLDSMRLNEVMTNLVTNAFKYTQKGHIKIGYRLADNDRVRIFVEDTGCGIAKENQTKIFNRFEKLNSLIQGAGLGLSICKAYITEAGGKIWVDSTVDVGSTFWIELPISSC